MNGCREEICLFEEFLIENISTELFSADDYITLGKKCILCHPVPCHNPLEG